MTTELRAAFGRRANEHVVSSDVFVLIWQCFSTLARLLGYASIESIAINMCTASLGKVQSGHRWTLNFDFNHHSGHVKLPLHMRHFTIAHKYTKSTTTCKHSERNKRCIWAHADRWMCGVAGGNSVLAENAPAALSPIFPFPSFPFPSKKQHLTIF